MKSVLIVILVATAVSCVTAPEPVVLPRPEKIRSDLLHRIESGQPERAVQRIGALRRDDLIPDQELDEILADAVRSIREDYEDALREDRPQDAILAYRNLVTLGVEELDDTLLSNLYLEHAVSLAEQENEPAALSALLQAPQLSTLPVAALERAVEIALRLNNRYAVSVLAEILGPAWRGANPDAVEFAEGSVSPVEMSAGVVTIWVNRGLRLENGVGIPDRVIGSGFFVDSQGYVVTNYHVISSEVDPEYEGYSRLFIRLPSDPTTRIPARVVGYSPIFDVALLKVEIEAPYVFSFTDIRALEPGARIVAIGSPGGLENSISSGIISAVGRRFLQMGDAMQVDVPINPGNSGGPLLDSRGRLVGVVFAGIPQFEGVNFAIPSYWINTFFPDLYEPGSVTHPWLGVAVEPTSDGLEVIYVARGSPAEEAGLQAGDVIVSVGEWPANRIASVQSFLLQRGVGALVDVRWMRDGAETTGLLSIAERPASPVEVALEREIHDRLYPVLFGMAVERIGGFSFRQSYRVTRVYRGSIADETGITTGDTFVERDFEFDDEFDVVFLRMFIQKRTEGFMQTSIQLPAYVERDNFL